MKVQARVADFLFVATEWKGFLGRGPGVEIRGDRALIRLWFEDVSDPARITWALQTAAELPDILSRHTE